MVARRNLRTQYLQADIGISGANFILADVGGIAVTENEGNARLSMSFPKTHIVIVGIEKMIPTMQHLSLFWPLLATFGTGQQVTVYNTIVTGPRQESETTGPEEMYVILLDNGRSHLLNQPRQRESLYCIRCGACLNACPVYKNIGGHSYGTAYSGPIGAVITPHLQGMKSYGHLSFASSLCGNCTEVCPVHIDLHNLLVYNRHDAVQQKRDFSEKTIFYFWKKGMLSRSLMNMANGQMKALAVRLFFGNRWGAHRQMPRFPRQSFNQLWRKQNNA
jgi:L-lactate dehydrogenase complex protein LldF